MRRANHGVARSLLNTALLLASAAAPARPAFPTHHVRDAQRHARAVGHLPATQILQLDVVLRLRDTASPPRICRSHSGTFRASMTTRPRIRST